ncbi:tyrosine-type recombinase/integrase [Streptomyces sp. NPDC096538]|uniref:tyrosine-type recombinase/integrase n=1 Tax=Streptomyces sp. NPDC096538 TaxID=3155427 RepID=UPI00332DE558
MSARRLDEAFETARKAAGLPEELDLHGLRHSYVTHLVEFGYPERFVQDQVGHAYASTTAIYTNPRELHQTGEKSQVARSRRELEGLRGYYDLAA